MAAPFVDMENSANARGCNPPIDFDSNGRKVEQKWCCTAHQQQCDMLTEMVGERLRREKEELEWKQRQLVLQWSSIYDSMFSRPCDPNRISQLLADSDILLCAMALAKAMKRAPMIMSEELSQIEKFIAAMHLKRLH